MNRGNLTHPGNQITVTRLPELIWSTKDTASGMLKQSRIDQPEVVPSSGCPSVRDIGPKFIIRQAIVFPIDAIQSFLQSSDENVQWTEPVLILWAAFDADGQCAVIQEESDSATHVGAIKDLDSVSTITNQYNGKSET